jgi:hypothetical protein
MVGFVDVVLLGIRCGYVMLWGDYRKVVISTYACFEIKLVQTCLKFHSTYHDNVILNINREWSVLTERYRELRQDSCV